MPVSHLKLKLIFSMLWICSLLSLLLNSWFWLKHTPPVHVALSRPILWGTLSYLYCCRLNAAVCVLMETPPQFTGVCAWIIMSAAGWWWCLSFVIVTKMDENVDTAAPYEVLYTCVFQDQKTTKLPARCRLWAEEGTMSCCMFLLWPPVSICLWITSSPLIGSTRCASLCFLYTHPCICNEFVL